MAEQDVNTLLDNLGRVLLPNLSMTLQQVAELLKQTKTTTTEQVSKQKPMDTSRLEELLTNFVAGFKETSKAQSDFVDDVSAAMKDVKRERQERKKASSGRDPKMDKEAKFYKSKLKNIRMIEKLERTYARRWTKQEKEKMVLATKIFAQNKRIRMRDAVDQAMRNRSQMDQIEEMAKSSDLFMQATQKGFSNVFDEYETRESMMYDKFIDKMRQRQFEFQRDVEFFTSWMPTDAAKTVFGEGILKEQGNQLKFSMEVRDIAYEINEVTNLTVATQNRLLSQYEELTAVTRGFKVAPEVAQKEYLKLLRSGVRQQKTGYRTQKDMNEELKEAKNLMKNQVVFERLLGMEAGSLHDTFRDLYISSGMTNNEISEIGRGMKQVSRSSGLTGENLKSAVESSKTLIRNLTMQGKITTQQVKSIMGVTAAAQKFGVGDQANDVLKAIVDRDYFLLEMDDKMKAFLAQAANRVGVFNDLVTGAIKDMPEKQARLAEGMEMVMMDRIRMYGINSIDELDRLTAAQLSDLNTYMKQTTNMMAGEARLVIKSIKEANQPVSETIKGLNKELEQSLTNQEKLVIQEKIRNLGIDAGLRSLTQFETGAKKVKTMDEALQRFNEKRGDFAEDLKLFGAEGLKDRDAVKSVLEQTMNKINEGLRSRGLQEVQINHNDIAAAFADGAEPALARELISKLNDGQMRLENMTKAQLGNANAQEQVLMDMRQALQQIQENTAKAIQDNYLGKLALIAGNVAQILQYVAYAAIGAGATLFGKRLIMGMGSTASKLFGPAGSKILDIFGKGGKVAPKGVATATDAAGKTAAEAKVAAEAGKEAKAATQAATEAKVAADTAKATTNAVAKGANAGLTKALKFGKSGSVLAGLFAAGISYFGRGETGKEAAVSGIGASGGAFGGGLAGATALGSLGSLFGPVGTAVGGFVGGVGGSVLGAERMEQIVRDLAGMRIKEGWEKEKEGKAKTAMEGMAGKGADWSTMSDESLKRHYLGAETPLGRTPGYIETMVRQQMMKKREDKSFRNTMEAMAQTAVDNSPELNWFQKLTGFGTTEIFNKELDRLYEMETQRMIKEAVKGFEESLEKRRKTNPELGKSNWRDAADRMFDKIMQGTQVKPAPAVPPATAPVPVAPTKPEESTWRMGGARGFANGTRQIVRGGLATLHANEVVMPRSVVQSLSAVGSGPFGSVGGFLGGLISKSADMTRQRTEAGFGRVMGALSSIASNLQYVSLRMQETVSGSLRATPGGTTALQSLMSARMASDEPGKTQVVSPELSEMADENKAQTRQQSKLVGLFEQVVALLQPSAQTVSNVGEVGDTSAEKVGYRPAKYFRNPVGFFSQSPTRNVTNVGVPQR